MGFRNRCQVWDSLPYIKLQQTWWNFFNFAFSTLNVSIVTWIHCETALTLATQGNIGQLLQPQDAFLNLLHANAKAVNAAQWHEKWHCAQLQTRHSHGWHRDAQKRCSRRDGHTLKQRNTWATMDAHTDQPEYVVQQLMQTRFQRSESRAAPQAGGESVKTWA